MSSDSVVVDSEVKERDLDLQRLPSLAAVDSEKQTRDASAEDDAAEHEHEYPEGGVRAWVTVAGAWLELFISFGLVNSFGALEDYFVRAYLTKTSLSAIGWVASVQSFLIYAVGPFIGTPFDRGYFYHLILAGAALYTFSLFMLSLAQPEQFYQIFLSYGVASGAGLGLILLPSTSVIGQYFNQRLPFASGIAFTGASVGGLSIPPLMNYLLNGNVGYANGMKIIAALLGVLSFVGIALMRPYPARSNSKSTLRTKTKRTGTGTGTGTARSMNFAAYARDVEYVLVVVALFCISLSIVYPLFYLQLDATQHHVSDNVAFNTLTIMNAAAILGRIVPNFLSQRLGLVNTIMFNTLACAAIILAMLSITSSAAAPFLAVAVIYGFFSGAVLSQMTPLLAAQARTVHEIGSRTGVGFLFIGIAMLVGPPIMGALLTKEYHWWRATVYSVVLMVAGAGALAVARRWRVRRLGTHYV